MSNNRTIATMGIDIGKNPFNVVGRDRRARLRVVHGQVEAAATPPCLVGIAACAGAHHLGRKLQAMVTMRDCCRRNRCAPVGDGQANAWPKWRSARR